MGTNLKAQSSTPFTDEADFQTHISSMELSVWGPYLLSTLKLYTALSLLQRIGVAAVTQYIVSLLLTAAENPPNEL
jgi:hypothetical protein